MYTFPKLSKYFTLLPFTYKTIQLVPIDCTEDLLYMPHPCAVHFGTTGKLFLE